MMDLANYAVIAVAIVAIIGVAQSMAGANAGAAISGPYTFKSAICTESSSCKSSWRCCVDGRCSCASDEDSRLYKVVTENTDLVECVANQYGMLDCGEEQIRAFARAGNDGSENTASEGIFLR